MSNGTEPRFLVDFMLGRLAKWLRLLGYDTVYSPAKDTTSLALESLREKRILLTRNQQLSAARAFKLVFIESCVPDEQLQQVVHELKLPLLKNRLYTRCTLCNLPLEAVVDKAAISGLVPEQVYAAHDTFSRCPGCHHIYWFGTHRDLLVKQLERAKLKLVDR